MTASDNLDVIAKARGQLRAAEVTETSAANALREARLAVKHAKERLSEAIDEALDLRRQPRLPFMDEEPEPASFAATDAPPPSAPTWRLMTLADVGFTEGEDAWGPETCGQLAKAGVTLCGDLADRLLAGEHFLLRPPQLTAMYDALEALSSVDPEPIHFTGALYEVQVRLAEERAAESATKLSAIDGFPDAVADALLSKGISTLPTLMERVEQTPGVAELPLRNKLVACLVREGVKIRPAERAADAVATHVGQCERAAAAGAVSPEPAPSPDDTDPVEPAQRAAGQKPAEPVKVVDVLNLPKPKRVRKPNAAGGKVGAK